MNCKEKSAHFLKPIDAKGFAEVEAEREAEAEGDPEAKGEPEVKGDTEAEDVYKAKRDDQAKARPLRHPFPST